MKIKSLVLHPYDLPYLQQQYRLGVLIHMVNEWGEEAWGEIAPLPKWSTESLEEALLQLKQIKNLLLAIDWTTINYFSEVASFTLLPSVSFGVESALLSLLYPSKITLQHRLPLSALLIGSKEDILSQAGLRKLEGYTSAKLKVSHLSFDEAAKLIYMLKDDFRLHIDVNRAWSTAEALQFFSQFPLDTFDYVEEPFKQPTDLHLFTHPLGVDESFPSDLNLKNLEALPMLKALIYKPTMQGGLSSARFLHEWTKKQGIDFVLSSSFESDVGLVNIAFLAKRLKLSTPIGIGTYHCMGNFLKKIPFKITHGSIII